MRKVSRDEYHYALADCLHMATFCRDQYKFGQGKKDCLAFWVGIANSGRSNDSFAKPEVLQLIHIMKEHCRQAGKYAQVECFCIKVGADEQKRQEAQFFLGQHARGECPFADYGKNA